MEADDAEGVLVVDTGFTGFTLMSMKNYKPRNRKLRNSTRRAPARVSILKTTALMPSKILPVYLVIEWNTLVVKVKVHHGPKWVTLF